MALSALRPKAVAIDAAERGAPSVCERKPQQSPSATSPDRLVPEHLSPGAPFRSTVCPKCHGFLGIERYNRAGKSSEQNTRDFHACLYSLRDHPHGSGWSRRLLGTPRKGRRRRAIEARLNDEIASHYFISACLSLRQASPGRVSSAGAFFRVCLRRPLHHSRVARALAASPVAIGGSLLWVNC